MIRPPPRSTLFPYPTPFRSAEAVAQLLPIRGKANRFGGSHAQRDVFSWTLMEAALRLGNGKLAEAMAAERLAAKRSEEHTSELQSRQYLVCRLLLETKKRIK